MKTVYLIGGTMGVGKTTVSQYLKQHLDNAVFLDGDWCWDTNPFIVNDETKTMVMNNICYLLNNFICCESYDNIIFCWVMHEQSIIDEIISRLDLTFCELKVISLICDEITLKDRILKDVQAGVRQSDVLNRSLERLPLYQNLSTIKIDTSHLSLEEIKERILDN